MPQGSVLGPVLFTVFINTIVPLPNCQVHLYADDTILHCFADSVKIAMEQLQASFNVLPNILTDLKLVINAQKIQFMLFCSTRSNLHPDMCIITLKGSTIQMVSEYKYIGIWLDEKLAFYLHIDNLVAR